MCLRIANRKSNLSWAEMTSQKWKKTSHTFSSSATAVTGSAINLEVSTDRALAASTVLH